MHSLFFLSMIESKHDMCFRTLVLAIAKHIKQSRSEKISFLYFIVNAFKWKTKFLWVYCNGMQWISTKNKVLNICTLLFATGIHRYLIFHKLAHVAFCKQTLQMYIWIFISSSLDSSMIS